MDKKATGSAAALAGLKKGKKAGGKKSKRPRKPKFTCPKCHSKFKGVSVSAGPGHRQMCTKTRLRVCKPSGRAGLARKARRDAARAASQRSQSGQAETVEGC